MAARCLGLGPRFMFNLAFAQAGRVLLGTTIARQSQDRTVVAWDVATGVQRWSQPIPSQAQLVVSHDQTWVATFDAKNLRLWDLPTGQLLRMFDRSLNVAAAVSRDRLLSLEQVPIQRADGTLVAGGACVFEFNVRTGMVESYFGLGAEVSRLAADATGSQIACCGMSLISGLQELAVWDLATKTRLLGLVGHLTDTLAFRPGTQELILPFEAQGPLILDASTGATLARLTDPKIGAAHAMALSANGRWLATSHGDQADNHAPIEDQAVRVWDLERRCLQRRISVDGPCWPGALHLADDASVLAAHANEQLWLWRFASS